MKIKKNYLIGFVLLSTVSLTLSSWKKESFEPSILSPTLGVKKEKKPEFSPAELFKGIMFFEGEVANKIPELYTFVQQRSLYDASYTQKIDLFNDIKFRCLQEKYPTYLNDFSKDLLSKDINQIGNRIIDAQSKMESITKDLIQPTHSNFSCLSSVDKNAISLVQSNQKGNSTKLNPPCGVAALYKYIGVIDYAGIINETIIVNENAFFWAQKTATVSELNYQKMLNSISKL